MQITSRLAQVTIALLFATALFFTSPSRARAAQVGNSGYTNAFGTAPLAADWSTLSVAGASADLTTPAALDAAVSSITASAVNQAVVTDSAAQMAANAVAAWSSVGLDLQTRPTGNAYNLLMCTLINNLGVNANSATINYDFTVSGTPEEVNGLRAFYSLTGAAGSWTLIPSFSVSTSGRLTATLPVNWAANGPLYILWADDNGAAAPDAENHLDNFFASATPDSEIPANITSQPTNATVAELQPVSFTVGVGGFPTPTVQWYSNGVALAGATNTAFSLATAPLNASGSGFHAVVQNTASNVFYSVTSSVATLTVNADVIAPALVSVASAGLNAVVLSFTERVLESTATNLANYFITNNAGVPLAITSATLAPDLTNVSFTTATQALGGIYTLVISGVRDLSAAANMIATNTTGLFITADYTAANIGNPAIPGSIVQVPGGYNVTGAGSDIGGTGDQFTFAHQQRAGDFDFKVRVATVGFRDPWTKASLMARATLDSNSVFAATEATPLLVGSVFESRATTGSASVKSGNFPSSYPDTWLRLSRVGNLFTGYASLDGQNWVTLGSVTLAVGPVYLGYAVTSHDVQNSTTAQFRDFGVTGSATGVALSSYNFITESLSAAARTGPIVISEIMYKSGPLSTNNLEFVELYNSNPYFEDISGYRLAGDIDFQFPVNTVLPGGTFLVIAKNPAAVMAYYGLTGVLGPYSNSLPANGTLRLRGDSEFNNVLLEVKYEDKNPWPVGADGTGHSLVLTRASYGQGHPKSWDASDRIGGSPGGHEAPRQRAGLRAVVINEILAHTVLPLVDYIELYNYSTQAVDISGCYLSDAPSTNKYRIPGGTILPPRGYLALDETQLGFQLDNTGETLYLRSADGTRMLDAVEFEAQESGVALGRYPDGAPEFYRLTTRTPGTTNSAPRVDDIVINEIMYGPISEEAQDEYVELYNKGAAAVDVSGWRFTRGINFTFSANSSIPAGGYVVVAKDKAHLLGNYANLNNGNTFGNFGGTLSRDGERVALAKPEVNLTTNGQQVLTNIAYLVVEEVTYGPGGRWGKWANQGGSSLELIDARSNHRLAYNWADSDETQKAPWTFFEHTGLLDTGSTQGGSAINRLEITMLGEGECLLDDLEARYAGGTNANLLANPGFELGLSPWTPQGNHVRSSLEFSGRTGSRSLRVLTGGNGDSGANRVRVALTADLAQGQLFTLRGWARWQHGWPEVLMRVKGGFLENYGRMQLPSNLGTPGAANSRALTNAAPAIYGVTHFPVLPQTGESVVVTAGVQDPQGVTNVVLFWRVDSAAPPAFTQQFMVDNGTGGDAVAGDGIYSTTIPAQAASTMVSFYLESTDTLLAKSQFPVAAIVPAVDGQRRECLVRWNEPIPVAAFSSYRLWMSAANVSAYQNRPALSNHEVDGTMIVNNNRPIYNVVSRYSNSPYHQGQNGSPVTGSTHFVISLPSDDKYLGEDNFNKVHAPGNGGFDDPTLMREQVGYYVCRKMGLPYLYRRHVAMFVNGNRKGGVNALQEDTQRPGGELINEFFPDETEGRLFKIQPWFEFDDVNVSGGTGAGFDNKLWCTLTRNLSTNAHKIARYRQNWLTRSADKTANDYTNVIAIIEAANIPSSNPTYWQNFSGLVDIDQWTRIFAHEHAMGNWDSFGNVNAQNMYGYKPKDGKWKLMIWDHNIVINNPNLGGTGSDLPSSANIFNTQSGQDPQMAILNAYPPFRRAWWRAYKELVNGPMQVANVYPYVNAKYKSYLDSGVNVASAPVEGIKTFIDTARNNISNAMAAVDFNGFNVTTPTVSATVSNVVTITGNATFDITTVEFNGVARPVIWTSITSWTATIPVTNNAPISVAGYNKTHTAIGTPASVTVNYALPALPDPRGFVVFNEIMYNPSPNTPEAEYIELFNTHSNLAFNLGNWRINGLDYTFPPGAFIGPRGFLLLVKNRVTFSVAFGASIPVYDQFSGALQGDGESLSLLQPGSPEIVVDRVRYESAAPWNTNANNTGSSLQLIDPNQDNSRAGNWNAAFIPAVYSAAIITPPGVRDGWRFFSASGSSGTGENGSGPMRFLLYLGEAGTAWIDDLSIVPGTNAGVGPNYVSNGDFESPLVFGLTNSWFFGTNYTNTTIVGDLVHTGAGAFKIVGASPGAANNPTYSRTMYQFLSPAPPVNSTNTLSFWYWATNSATNLYARVRNSAFLQTATNSGFTNINIFFTPSNYVPPQIVSPATNSYSPGSNNLLSTTLPAFKTLWINEVQAENTLGIFDHNGEREPWIEIYNTSTNTVLLDGLFLTHTYTNYTNWAFPSGSSIGPTQFLVVFCDGEPNETTNSEYHTSFRLPAVTGGVALSRLFTNAPQVMDFVNYSALPADRSYGSFPDGQPFDRQQFFYVTPRGTNDGRSAPITVFINEWMASNLSILADPADSQFEDWFELYNPTTNLVNLAGYYLTDELTNKFKYLITTNGAHTIAPHGYLLVWADNEVNQNTVGGTPRADLHVNFSLAKAGEAIGLFAADGSVVDSVSFPGQLDNFSTGRYPDGTANFYFMESTTPRLPNFYNLGSNTPPVLDLIGNKVVYLGQTLAFTATASDTDIPAQVLTFTLLPTPPAGASITGAGAFTWTPTAVGTNTISVRVTDSGSPAENDTETITVEVLNAPSFANSALNNGSVELQWPTRPGKQYAIDYKADLNSPTWTPLWTNTATGISLSFTNSTTNAVQRFFRIRTVN